MTEELCSRLVAAIALPVSVSDLPGIVDALEAEHGPGLRVSGSGRWMLVHTPGKDCGCGTCDEGYRVRLAELTDDPLASMGRQMIVCPHCGDKRCPRAAHHANPCPTQAARASDQTSKEGPR